MDGVVGENKLKTNIQKQYFSRYDIGHNMMKSLYHMNLQLATALVIRPREKFILYIHSS